MTARVLVIIPAYNEEATIGAVLDTLRAEVPSYTVLVIDDGSCDRTAEIVEARDDALLVRMPFNVGIGSAMQTGYKFALRHGFDIAIQCDADGQHPVGQMPKLVEKLREGNLDLVIGSRYVADTGYNPSFSRRLGKSLLSRLVNGFIGGGITDTTSGYRAANRRVIANFAHHYPDDYPEAESLVLLHMHGLKAGEVPVTMQPRQGGVTSISPPHAAYYIVKVALAIFVDLFRSYRAEREPPES